VDRVLLTLLIVAVIVAAWGGLWWGWRNRARRQADVPAPPALPARLAGLSVMPTVAPLAGVYVSTTRCGAWQDRLVGHGLGRRARAELLAYPEGLVLDRVGEDPIFVPAQQLSGLTAAPGIAGKVMGLPEGILVVTWSLGEQLVDTGFRADDPDRQREFVAAVPTVLPALSRPSGTAGSTDVPARTADPEQKA
jgi:hypothetical protein